VAGRALWGGVREKMKSITFSTAREGKVITAVVFGKGYRKKHKNQKYLPKHFLRKGKRRRPWGHHSEETKKKKIMARRRVLGKEKGLWRCCVRDGM